ncbi:MAG: DUF4373 domain-containing protein [Clostridia bacterium]|nr:DUF4373 domain-containing protein [Clostridia bacterium]
MGRNLKSGMDYFDHSTTAHADIKLEKVMAWYGAEGYAVYFYLLEKIYAEPDYELQINDEDTLILIANRLKLDTNKLRDIIAKCVSVGLFDEEKYQLGHILTSHGIKKRADEVETARENKRNYKNSRLQNKNSSEKNGDCSRENTDSSEKNAILDRENAHIKTEQIRTEQNKTEQIKTKENSTARHCFVKPTVEEIAVYCAERNNGVDAEQFFAFYESVGWKVGNKSMKDWKSAVITWEKRNREKQHTVQSQSTNPFLNLAMQSRGTK